MAVKTMQNTNAKVGRTDRSNNWSRKTVNAVIGCILTFFDICPKGWCRARGRVNPASKYCANECEGSYPIGG